MITQFFLDFSLKFNCLSIYLKQETYNNLENI